MVAGGQRSEHLRVLPPSANWYCSKVCDWGRSDVLGLLFAFGAKNSVLLYQVAEVTRGEAQETGVKVAFLAQLVRGKRDRRVTAVQFLTDSTGELRLVCGGEEGSVQIWDVATMTMIEQHRRHKAEVMAVTVSATLDANLVVAGDRQGRISAWERDAGKVSLFAPIAGDGIHSMAISPHDKTVVAVGYRSGVLCLVDAAHGTVRHRLDGHDQEVQCLAWKATVGASQSAIEAETSVDHEIWLASSSRDKTIKVWRIPSNAAEVPALDQVLRLPSGKQGMSFTQTKQLWLPVAWNASTPGNHCLWSGSFDGSLFRWEWGAAKSEDQAKKSKNRRAACKPVVVKGGHSRMLFSIVMVPPRSAALKEDDSVSMVTVSLDRELRLWKEQPVSKSSPAAICVEKLIGLGGHAYSTAYNATTELLAAGIGDQTIRLWNLSAGSSDYECDLLWRGLQSKITCVQWHPIHHSLLAYGMEDGRIGVYDIQSKKYNHFRSTHDHEIKQLQWIVADVKLPSDVGDGDNSFLESLKQLEAAQAKGQTLEDALVVQEGQAAKHRGGNEVKVVLWSRDASGHVFESNADATDQNSREVMTDCTAFALGEQSGLLAIGLENGVVKLMAWGENDLDDSTEQTRFHEHSESITCLAWSKDSNDALLASGGQDGKVFVYSNAKATPSSIESSRNFELVGVMEAHSNSVTDLRWCVDASSRLLASSSADGSAQVWNAASLEREAYFNHHVGRVLSIEWVSQYTLVTGGEDQTLRLWDYRKLQKDPPTKQKKNVQVKQPQEVGIKSGESRAGLQTQKEKATKTDSLVEASSTDKCEAKTISSNTSKNKSMVLFHPEAKLSTTEIASVCSRIGGFVRAEDEEKSGDGVKTNDWKNSFLAHSDRASVHEFFASETKRYEDERDWESVANTLLLQNKVIDALRIVAKEGALSPTWLSYAPMAGMDVWREMTNLYAQQLSAQGDNKAAALHFLSIAKVRAAIMCLVSADAFREALALIRSRLGPHDPLLRETLWKYADFLVKRGQNGDAALALLQIGSVKAKTRAIHTLVNTGDMILVKSALDQLLSVVNPPVEDNCTDASDIGNSNPEFAFPASFFISIAGRALAKSRFDIAETAAQLVQSRLVATASSKSYKLTWCLLKILKIMHEHQPRIYKFDGGDSKAKDFETLMSYAPSACELFKFLTGLCEHEEENGIDQFYRGVLSRYAAAIHAEEQLSKQQVAQRGIHFWLEVLSACQECGYWFDAEGQARVQEAQNLLVETNCFVDIEKAVSVSASEGTDNAIAPLLQVAQRLLCFMIDVLSSSFIGALEHMREAFLLLAQSKDRKRGEGTNSLSSDSKERVGDFQLDVMLLLYPIGFASPKEIPQCGELGDEQLDTLVLWSSVLLSQCKIVPAALVKKVSPADNVLVFGQLLRLLRSQFLGDEAASLSEGLMDAANQSQLQSLLNEMLVIAHQLPDSLPLPQDKSKDSDEAVEEEKKDGLSMKQALINDVNELRSRLTWSADGVEE